MSPKKFCPLFAFVDHFGKKKFLVWKCFQLACLLSIAHCSCSALASFLQAEEEVHVLSLRWLTLLVQVAHPSIRAIFIRAAFRSLATGQAASDRVGGSQF